MWRWSEGKVAVLAPNADIAAVERLAWVRETLAWIEYCSLHFSGCNVWGLHHCVAISSNLILNSNLKLECAVEQWCNPLCLKSEQAEWVRYPVGPHPLSVMIRGLQSHFCDLSAWHQNAASSPSLHFNLNFKKGWETSSRKFEVSSTRFKWLRWETQ